MKKIIAIMVCFLLIGCGKSESEILKFKEEYEAVNEKTGIVMNIDDEVNLKYLTSEDAYKMISSGNGIIYFGYPECPWCRNAIPVLFEVAKENNMTVSYFNPSEFRDKNDETYARIIGALYDYLETDDKGNKTLYVPDVYFIKDGKIIGHHLSTVESQTDPKINLTEEQRNELKTIYQDLLKQIK